MLVQADAHRGFNCEQFAGDEGKCGGEAACPPVNCGVEQARSVGAADGYWTGKKQEVDKVRPVAMLMGFLPNS